MVHAQHQLHAETKLDQEVAVSSLRCCWLCCPISHLLHTGREMGTAEILAFCGKEVGAGRDGRGFEEGEEWILATLFSWSHTHKWYSGMTPGLSEAAD